MTFSTGIKSALNPINEWDKLLRDFRDGRAILFTGPGISTTSLENQEVSLQEAAALEIANYLDSNGVSFEKNEISNLAYITQRFLKIENATRIDLESIVADFYKAHTRNIPQVYHQLAALPVTFIVNTTPDDYIIQSLRAHGKRCTVIHYNFKKGVPGEINLEDYSPDHPLVFQLLGTVEDMESLILTESDQMDFIKSVVKGDPKLPEEFLSIFDARKRYVFLGFNVDQWQFRLLLDSLKLYGTIRPISPHLDNYNQNPVNRTFFEDRFRFLFLDQKTHDFVEGIRNSLFQTKTKTMQKVFISSHAADEKTLEELIKYLAPLQQNKDIEIWHQQMTLSGTDILIEKNRQINEARFFLLLISADYLASTETIDELNQINTLVQTDSNKKILPVIVKFCDWRANDILSRTDTLPSNGKPLSGGDWMTTDEAYNTIIKEFKKYLET